MKILLEKIVKKNKLKTKFGNVADYIPGLNRAGQEDLGICLLDMDGNKYVYGDSYVSDIRSWCRVCIFKSRN